MTQSIEHYLTREETLAIERIKLEAFMRVVKQTAETTADMLPAGDAKERMKSLIELCQQMELELWTEALPGR